MVLQARWLRLELFALPLAVRNWNDRSSRRVFDDMLFRIPMLTENTF